MKPIIVLKPGREATVLGGHPWIFSGAIKEKPADLANGSIVSVTDAAGQVIATGSYSARSMIAVRVFSFSECDIDHGWLFRAIESADERRRLLGYGRDDRSAYRVVYGESDRLPGLVVDRYGDVLVMQLATVGIDQLREEIVGCLVELFRPTAVYERSDLVSRREEGLSPATGVRYGELPERVDIRRGDRQYVIDVVGGQKTGFFLDQEDLRDEIPALSRGRVVADLFCYSGAGGLAALLGGAVRVDFVDSSEPALEWCRRQTDLNGIDPIRYTTEAVDVFQWLGGRSEPMYDLLLLDPPALIKSKKHLDDGRKGYHFLNRAALRLVRDGGIIATSSCSAFFTPEDFRLTLVRAARQVGVELHVLKRLTQGADHPVALSFPEAAYLQTFMCQVERR